MFWSQHWKWTTWTDVKRSRSQHEHIYISYFSMKFLSLHFFNLCRLLGDGCNIRVTNNIKIVVVGGWLLVFSFSTTWWEETPKTHYWALLMVYHDMFFITLSNIMPTIGLFKAETFPVQEESFCLNTIIFYLLCLLYLL